MKKSVLFLNAVLSLCIASSVFATVSAEEQNLDISAIPETGDVNGDGRVDVTDLTELSVALVDNLELTAEQKYSSDVNGDGNVSLADLAKFRQFLSKQITSLGSGADQADLSSAELTDITDRTVTEYLCTDSMLEKFFADENYIYYFSSVKSSYIECTFSDGTKMDVNEALAGKLVSVEDLDRFGIAYIVTDSEGNFI